MKRWLVTVAIAMVCVVHLQADVTVTTTATIEGPAAALAGSNGNPTIVTQIKGNRSRSDIDLGGQGMSALIDLTTKQMILLQHGEKTAQVLDPASLGSIAKGAAPKLDTTVKPTGRKQEISGEQCEEFTVLMKMDMASMASTEAAPQAAAVLKDVRMSMGGSVWVAKGAAGAAEYQAFQAGAARLMMSALARGQGKPIAAGMEQVILGFSDAPGIPYLTELTMAVEGTGPMVDIMKQMGQLKIVTRVTSVSVDPLPDSVFKVPDGYKVVK